MTKRALVVVAVALLALGAFAALIPASEVPNAEHHHYYYSAGSSSSSTHDQSGAAAPQMSEKEALNAYEKLPLSFIPNEGQTNEAVRYYAQGAGYGFFFTKGGAMLSFAEGKGRGQALALSFLGANPHAKLEAQKRLSGEVNYLVGDDPTKWRRRLPTHGELLYGGLWPGIDMAVGGQEGGKLKYEFRLQPGSSVDDIRLAYRGAERLSSTFLGRAGNDQGFGIAVDGDGRAYVTGFTRSAFYPTTPGAFDRTFNGGFSDVFVTKLPTG